MKNQEEVWLPVKGYEGIYEISNLGRLKSLERFVRHWTGCKKLNKERVLKPSLDNRGYVKYVLSLNGKTKTRTAHQLIAESFLGFKQCGHKLVVNHINLNKVDNRIENLEIVTQRENSNMKHKKSSSKYTGVSYFKESKKWRAEICINGKPNYLGLFKNEKVASAVYQMKLESLTK